MLACYSPADGADHAEECSKLHYFAEKDRLFEVKAVLLFWGFVCEICEICGRIGRSRVSRGKKMQKLKKFRANEYRVKFT